MKGKILIIEDEEDIVKGLKINLIDEGYEVDWALDGETGIRKAFEETPDLIILDIMLPEMDGLDVCRELRKKDVNIPILMLTAKKEEIDRVVGLEIAADDYITKPFSVRELLARIKAQLRRVKRGEQSVQNKYSFEDVEIDFVHYKIRRKGKEIDTTSLEIKILKYLIEHRGQIVSRDDLLNEVWGYNNFPTTRTIDNHIENVKIIFGGQVNWDPTGKFITFLGINDKSDETGLWLIPIDQLPGKKFRFAFKHFYGMV